jgi:hypothetical protein
VAQGAGNHAEAGAAFALARARQHQQDTLLFLGAGNAFVHHFLLGRHTAGVAFGVFGAFTHVMVPSQLTDEMSGPGQIH